MDRSQVLALIILAIPLACAKTSSGTYLPVHEREWKSWTESSISVNPSGTCQDKADMMRLYNRGDRPINALVCESKITAGVGGSRNFIRHRLAARASIDVGCTKQGPSVVAYSLAWSDLDDGHVPVHIANANEALITFKSSNYVVMNRHAKKTIVYGWHQANGQTDFVTLAPGGVTTAGPRPPRIFKADYVNPYGTGYECVAPTE